MISASSVSSPVLHRLGQKTGQKLADAVSAEIPQARGLQAGKLCRAVQKIPRLNEYWEEHLVWFPQQKMRIATAIEKFANQIRKVFAGAMMGLPAAVKLPKWLHNKLTRDYFYSPRKVMSLKFQDKALNKAIWPQSFPLDPESESLDTLHSFYLEAQNNKPTIVFFHGRDTNIGHLEAQFMAAKEKGYGFFAVDYPGFGRSEGLPDEEGLKKAGVAACKFLAGDGYKVGYGVPYNRQILMGYSLGGAVAVNTAKKFAKSLAAAPEKRIFNPKYGQQPLGLVVVNTFASIPKLMAAQLSKQSAYVSRWINPKQTTLKFNSEKAIAQVKMPVLVFNCKEDQVVPYQQGQMLAQALSKQKGKAGQIEFLKLKCPTGHSFHSFKEREQLHEVFAKADSFFTSRQQQPAARSADAN